MRRFRVFLFSEKPIFPFIFHLCSFEFSFADFQLPYCCFDRMLFRFCLYRSFCGVGLLNVELLPCFLHTAFKDIICFSLRHLKFVNIDRHCSQRAKRTHNLLLLKTAHLRCFIILLNIKSHLVRQRLVKQLVVNVNIPRSVCRIFVYRDVLDQFKSHFTSQLGNVCIFL